VLFAQPVIRVARLTVDDITIATGTVAIRLGSTAIVVPEPLAGELRRLVADRSCRATAQLSEPLWLFSGRVAGRPIDEQVLSRRLKRIGVDCGATRRTALLQLAGQMPAAVLADLLGINILTATKWAETAGRPWGDYPALRSS
jgi:hypothetical protein